MSGALFDFGLYFFHNAKGAAGRGGTGPYFYLPENREPPGSALVERYFSALPGRTGHKAAGSIRATVLIETILAAFEMDEILHELREHSSGLNCGRWDYHFQFHQEIFA